VERRAEVVAAAKGTANLSARLLQEDRGYQKDGQDQLDIREEGLHEKVYYHNILKMQPANAAMLIYEFMRMIRIKIPRSLVRGAGESVSVSNIPAWNEFL